jgi:hypothetical protein
MRFQRAARPTALRELGLPYASDPAITKHLAAFLTQAAIAMNSSSANDRMARPDAVLFNGGFCAPAVTRERIVEAISTWFGGTPSGWRPRVLNNEEVNSAVARGAAHYGRVRLGAGSRVRAGNARSYYIGLPSSNGLQGICVLPAGVEEGTTLPLLNREFSVLANRPVSFTLYSSRTRHHAHGEVASLDEADVHRHAPLGTMLRYGRKLRELYLIVSIRASFTEVGTLELWCESQDTQHRWRLQFELRGEEVQAEQLDTAKPQPVPARRTDRSRDIDDAIRERTLSRLIAIGVDEEIIQLLSKDVPTDRADAVRSFGESLPSGLQVVGSSNCLLSIPALHSAGSSSSTPAVPQVVIGDD